MQEPYFYVYSAIGMEFIYDSRFIIDPNHNGVFWGLSFGVPKSSSFIS